MSMSTFPHPTGVPAMSGPMPKECDDDFLVPEIPAAVAEYQRRAILFKHDRLVAEQAELARRREELLAQQRRNDRELAECRAAARFFEVDTTLQAFRP